MPFFLSLDAGTTSLKAALFDDRGQLLAIHRQEYSLEMRRADWIELEADIYWQACCSAIRTVLVESQVKPQEVLSLCISSQGETLISIDWHGNPVRKAIVWLDNRAQDEAREIAQHFTTQTIYQVSGQPEVTPTWPACKILWLRKHEPGNFQRARKFLLLEDYLLYRLTGRCVTECALQSSSLLLEINSRLWWTPMLDFIGIDPDQLGNLLQPGDSVGWLTTIAAKELGLSSATRVVAGGMDQVLGAIGAGNYLPGMVTESTGGALGIVASLDRPTYDPLQRIPCHVHAAPGGYCLLPWGQTAGMALKWFRDQFFPLEAQAAIQVGRDLYDDLTTAAAQVPAGCEGLICLPHLEGAVCPEFNPRARGVFFGATLRHTRAHFTRSILEAVAFMLLRNIELLAGLGVAVDEVRSTGGGARSAFWLQIKADVLQKPILRLKCEETALLGAAILGAVACRTYPNLEQACALMVHVSAVIHPHPENTVIYQQAYGKYLELYTRLETMF
jgi:xylulokinase